jgi:peptidoglycan-N-acetylglucosamine deacetylase
VGHVQDKFMEAGSMLWSRVLFLTFLIAFIPRALFSQNPKREIAITIDDLPSNNISLNGNDIHALNKKLVATLKQKQVPAVGFVNEKRLYVKDEVDERIDSLRMWVANGLELGNHTFSHLSLSQSTLADWEEEVVRGETVTRMLMDQRKMKIRYLRHPYLAVGRDIDTRRAADLFLTQRGYKVAPITMDAWDWMYAFAYDVARSKGDEALKQKLLNSYLEYTNQVFDYYEKLSKDLLGYEPKQILLLHCNWLEADHIAELLDTLRSRGYKFITLEEALTDPAYSVPDMYVGDDGTNWIEHWAVTRGTPPQHAPVFPEWVIEVSREMGAQTQPPL